jgi:hypothetical protein
LGSLHLAVELGYDIDQIVNVPDYLGHFSNAGLGSVASP